MITYNIYDKYLSYYYYYLQQQQQQQQQLTWMKGVLVV